MSERRHGASVTKADNINEEDFMETVKRFVTVLLLCAVSVISGGCGALLTANRTQLGGTGDVPQPRIPVEQNDAAIAPADSPGQRFGLTKVLAKLSAREDEPEEAAEFFALKRLPPGATALPVEQYQEAIEQMRQMPRYSTSNRTFMPPESESIVPDVAISLGSWSQLGPGNIGGRTRAILIDPVTPTTMYAAGVAGGVWKSTNGGASWSAVSDLIANLAVNSLAMDPANASVIYAGTGEGYFDLDAVRGTGIFKTTNGGTTWTQLANTAPPTSTNFYFVNKIVVSPNSSQRVYAATRTGIFRSLDGGSTWSQVLNAVAVNGCTDLVIRTDQVADYMFAACATFAQATVYRNTDAGGTGTWTAVLSEANMGRTSLAIAPSQQSTVYALASEYNTSAGTFQYGLHAAFRSTSNGDSGTWTAQVRNTSVTKLNTLLLTNPVIASLVECGFSSSNSFFNQGWYDNVIAVDPVDPNRVWVGGIDVFRSTDGGANWSLASYWWISPSDSQYAHADQHAIVFHPQYNGSTNQTMFVGNDGGLFRTVNATAGTSTDVCGNTQGVIAWSNLNQGYAVTQFYHGVPYPGGTTYFGGTQDNGTVRGTDAGGINGWTTIIGGDGGYVAVDPTNSNVLYAENYSLSIQKSTNGGVNWVSATNGITEPSGDFLFITPFAMDLSNSQRLWIGGFNMWRTTDGAASWVQASADTCGNGSVSTIAVAPTNANHVLAGMSDGCINRTTIGLTSTLSTTWAVSTPRAGYVSWLTFDPTNENIAYATYSTFGGTHVWKSSDGGATWAGIDGTGSTGIPDIPVHSVVVDPSDPSRLYIGTDLGVFASADGGATWAVENTGFANVITEALAIGSVNGTPNLFAFTHGRGAWRVALTRGGGMPSLSINDVTANEGNSGTTPFNFTVTLSPASSQTVTVSYATADGTATTAGSDYVAAFSNLTFNPGETTKPILVLVNGDTQSEPNETFFVNLSNATNATISDSQGIGTITNDDGCSSTPIAFGSTLNGSLSNGDCDAPDRPGRFADLYTFSGTTGQQISITMNSTIDTYLFLKNPAGTVIASNDDCTGAGLNSCIPSDALSGGSFTLPSSGTYTIEATSFDAGATGTYSVTLTLVAPVVTIAATDPNASEGGPDAGTFTATRTGPTTSPLTVNYTIGGTATNGTDYQTLTSPVTILAGSASATITVNPIDDAAVEGNETVIVTLAAGSGYTLGASNSATVTITDNDPVTVTIAATDPNASETGPDTGTFTVTRTGPTTSPLPVNYTVGGTATNGSDYTTLTSPVTILAGSATATITVSPVDDAVVEQPDETVVVTLASGTGYTVGSPSSATVTIADNDSTVPDTLINSGPATDSGGATKRTSATFDFTSTVAGSTFACSLDSAAFTACTSPRSYPKLKPGAHNFRVQATAGGLTDPTPAEFDWTVDTKAPNTAITSFPPTLTNIPAATFEFTSTEAGGGFQCSLDGGPFAPCTSPFTTDPLGDGKHNFQVKAVDAAGNLDKSAAKAKAWTVDTIRPITAITGKPTNPTTSTSAAFKFKSEKKSTFQCSLDGGAFEACKSGKKYSGLAKGNHNFQVQATDAAGNMELTPTSYSWSIQ